jgi:hypothetical protein
MGVSGRGTALRLTLTKQLAVGEAPRLATGRRPVRRASRRPVLSVRARVDFAGRENRVIRGDHGCAKVNHEPAVSPDGFMTASINNMQYSDYRTNRAANLRVIRGKHLKTDGETQRRGRLEELNGYVHERHIRSGRHG